MAAIEMVLVSIIYNFGHKNRNKMWKPERTLRARKTKQYALPFVLLSNPEPETTAKS